MIIKNENEKIEVVTPEDGDMLDASKINALGSCTAILIGHGMQVGLESVCVQTGMCRFDVSGQIFVGDIADIRAIVDYDGNEHDPDDFYSQND